MWGNITDLTVESQRPLCGVKARAPRIRLPSSLRNINLEVAGVQINSIVIRLKYGGGSEGWGDRFSIAVFCFAMAHKKSGARGNWNFQLPLAPNFVFLARGARGKRKFPSKIFINISCWNFRFGTEILVWRQEISVRNIYKYFWLKFLSWGWNFALALENFSQKYL